MWIHMGLLFHVLLYFFFLRSSHVILSFLLSLSTSHSFCFCLHDDGAFLHFLLQSYSLPYFSLSLHIFHSLTRLNICFKKYCLRQILLFCFTITSTCEALFFIVYILYESDNSLTPNKRWWLAFIIASPRMIFLWCWENHNDAHVGWLSEIKTKQK